MERTFKCAADLLPRSSVTTKLPTYKKPAGPPMSEAEQEAYRDIIIDFVFIAWRKLHRPVSLDEIYYGAAVFKSGIAQESIIGVKERVQSRIDNDMWPYAKFVRSKRTIDRRVNDAGSPDYGENNISYLVLVNPGIYQPNPEFLVKKSPEASF